MAVKNGTGGEQAAITIKKYANRRLYNTATSSYVTLDHLCQMVKDGVEFVVYDAKTGDDITRQVLTQIIVEEEAKGENLLPISFLRQLISFYGHGLQWMVPSYLDHMMNGFAENQEKMAKAMQDTMGGVFGFGNFEELGKQNMQLLERTMRMFTPFGGAQGKGAEPGKAGEAPTPAASAEAQLENLKRQVDLLQSQLETLSRKDKD
ncbi:polyhydroxyalkanoate synthesis repressor PhaR [Tistlia consotensis]|uniref:Polyhydroxyalkanoate synthesis repressor PhaR n=1 Tax=Tistlia consotensis USBA 355 TaxID=560819 RepID=A0A1Y6B766_9PROT|nr:polyhydroxyalkanoate synthesis repressor PhaR [Tistlia consotensis]SME91951.1 polyhydroxyalkanoate synthesis repressor PhaR [Tistlia consotensis USBA 355]SNR27722.1 polyhydroxyalkanoate synthesis repressor PhaR [Tistlia consotensis]